MKKIKDSEIISESTLKKVRNISGQKIELSVGNTTVVIGVGESITISGDFQIPSGIGLRVV